MTERRPSRPQRQRQRRSTAITVTLLGLALSIVLLAYLVFGDSNEAQALVTVRQVHVLFRHGDRNPTATYPSDPHKAHDWPGGFGALTTGGALRAFSLGQHLHQRYFRLLPPDSLYTQQNLLAASSVAERCLMSAGAMLAGLMPPLDGRHSLPIAWQPVPVVSVPRAEDWLLGQKRPCPRYDAELERLWANGTQELRDLNARSAELFAYLSRHTGLNITHIRHVESLYITLKAQAEAGLALPSWTDSVYPDRMRPLAVRTVLAFTETPYMRRIRGGALPSLWLDRMMGGRDRTLRPDRQVFVYAAHDVTMVNVLRGLGGSALIEQTAEQPDYAAALVAELHHSSTFKDDMEVKLVYYLNGDDKLPKEVRMPECPEPCSLRQFEAMLEPVRMHDYDEWCKEL